MPDDSVQAALAYSAIAGHYSEAAAEGQETRRDHHYTRDLYSGARANEHCTVTRPQQQRQRRANNAQQPERQVRAFGFGRAARQKQSEKERVNRENTERLDRSRRDETTVARGREQQKQRCHQNVQHGLTDSLDAYSGEALLQHLHGRFQRVRVDSMDVQGPERFHQTYNRRPNRDQEERGEQAQGEWEDHLGA